MDEYPDDLAITESHLPVSTSVDCPPLDCPTPWIWIILVILLILILIGLIVWVIYLYHRNSDSKGQNIELLNPVITVTDNSITATFVTNCNGTVSLFATLHPPLFNADGTLRNASAANHTVSSGPLSCTSGATGAPGTLTVSNLQQGVKYYATLIATNSSRSSNYKSYTQIVYTEDGNITPTFDASSGVTGPLFEIQDIIQIGAVQLNTATEDTFSTIFNQRPVVPRSLFFFNSMSQIEANTESTAGISNICLFNVNGSLVGANCITGPTGTAAGTVPANSQWVYNSSAAGANKLCLKNSIPTSTTAAGVTGPVCLKLTGIGNGTAALSVTSDTDAGDAWALAFTSLT